MFPFPTLCNLPSISRTNRKSSLTWIKHGVFFNCYWGWTFIKLWDQSDVKRVSFSEQCPSPDNAWLSSTSTPSVALWTRVVPEKHTCQPLSTVQKLDKTFSVTEALRIKTLTRSIFWNQDRIRTSENRIWLWRGILLALSVGFQSLGKLEQFRSCLHWSSEYHQQNNHF